MNRNEALHWWRQGYEAGRQAQAADDAVDRALATAVRQAAADRQAGTEALLREVIHVLAEAMLGEISTEERAA